MQGTSGDHYDGITKSCGNERQEMYSESMFAS
jgi:hypothetical protein